MGCEREEEGEMGDRSRGGGAHMSHDQGLELLR